MQQRFHVILKIEALVLWSQNTHVTAKTASLLLSAMHTAGSLSMGVGEYISVASQRDIEEADVQKERNAQHSGPESRASELEELVQTYADRG